MSVDGLNNMMKKNYGSLFEDTRFDNIPLFERKEFYEFDKPEFKERTKSRLIQMGELGMKEFGVASFGIEGVMSGLYIEKVWGYSDENWDSYIDWVKSLMK